MCSLTHSLISKTNNCNYFSECYPSWEHLMHMQKRKSQLQKSSSTALLFRGVHLFNHHFISSSTRFYIWINFTSFQVSRWWQNNSLPSSIPEPSRKKNVCTLNRSPLTSDGTETLQQNLSHRWWLEVMDNMSIFQDSSKVLDNSRCFPVWGLLICKTSFLVD